MAYQAKGKKGVGRHYAIALLALVVLANCAARQTPAQSEDLRLPSETCALAGECAPAKAVSDFGTILASAVFLDPQTQKAKADLGAARATLTAARKGVLPKLGLEARGQETGSVLVMSVQQPLWAGGRLRASKVEAQSAVIEAETALEVAQLSAAFAIIDAIGRWIEASEIVQAQQLVVDEYEKIAEMVTRRAENGLTSESELELVTARRNTLRAEFLSSIASRDIAKASLASLLVSAPADGPLREAARPRAGAGAITPQNLDAILASHPITRAANAGIARAEAGVKLARAERFPTLSIVGEDKLNDTASAADSEPTVYLGLSANLGPAQAVGNRVAAAQSRLESAIAAKDLRLRGLKDEINALSLRYNAAADRLDAYKDAMESSTAVLQSYREQMATAGGKSWQDVISAARELTDASRAFASAQAELTVTFWKLQAYRNGLSGL